MKELKLVLAKDLKVGQVVSDLPEITAFATVMKYRGRAMYQGELGYFFEYVSGIQTYMTALIPELDSEKELIGFSDGNEDFYEVN